MWKGHPPMPRQCAVALPKTYAWQELAASRLTVPAINLRPPYNIAPTTTIDAIIQRGAADRLELTQMRWGLIPS